MRSGVSAVGCMPLLGAALRGQWMYFYTDLRGLGRGLAGQPGEYFINLNLSASGN